MIERSRSDVGRAESSQRFLGDHNPNSQLTDSEALNLLQTYAGRKVKKPERTLLCQQYGCSDRTLWNLFDGISYRHLVRAGGIEPPRL